MDNREFYVQNGYIILKNAFSQRDIHAVWESIDTIFKGQLVRNGIEAELSDNGRITFSSLIKLYETDRTAYISCMKACQNIPGIMSLGNSQKLVSLLHEIGIKSPIYSTKPIFTLMSRFTSENYTSWKMPPHQDWRSIQGSINNVVAWVALTDCNHEVGPVEVVPKSHLCGLLDVEKDDWYYKLKQEFTDEEYISVPLEQGDCVVFSSFLVHRSGTNISQNLPRASIQFRYNDAEEESFINREYPSTYGSDRPERDYVIDEGISVTKDDVLKAL